MGLWWEENVVVFYKQDWGEKKREERRLCYIVLANQPCYMGYKMKPFFRVCSRKFQFCFYSFSNWLVLWKTILSSFFFGGDGVQHRFSPVVFLDLLKAWVERRTTSFLMQQRQLPIFSEKPLFLQSIRSHHWFSANFCRYMESMGQRRGGRLGLHSFMMVRNFSHGLEKQDNSFAHD